MTDFQKPQLGRRYANYENFLLPFEVTVDFWRRYGVVPEEVIFWKPGMWWAGPVPEDLPAPEMAMVASEEQTEAAPDLEGQARLL